MLYFKTNFRTYTIFFLLPKFMYFNLKGSIYKISFCHKRNMTNWTWGQSCTYSSSTREAGTGESPEYRSSKAGWATRVGPHLNNNDPSPPQNPTPQTKAGHNKNQKPLSWRDGSVFQSTCCSSRGPKFNAQNSHGGSQASVTSVPGDLMLSSGLLCGY